MVEAQRPAAWYQTAQGRIALLAVVSIAVSLVLEYTGAQVVAVRLPLFVAYVLGGIPLV